VILVKGLDQVHGQLSFSSYATILAQRAKLKSHVNACDVAAYFLARLAVEGDM
jgi:hypothetical protein